MHRLVLSADTVAPVRAGHPWVYRGATTPRFPPGEVVQLVDRDGKRVGWGLADLGPIAVRVLGRGAPEDLERLLLERVARASAVRPRLIADDTDAYRVVAGAGDGLPGLVVDRYAGLAVLRVYAEAWLPHLPMVVAAVARLGWVESVLRRFGVQRVDGKQGSELLHGPAPAELLVVREHGMRLLVRPYVGQKTGLFLDQREHRRRIGELGSGRIVANLFAYTGGFSVAAALGGAARVTTVDRAPEAIADARETFRLNDLDPGEHVFEVADVFKWSPRGQVDLLIVDPPSLTRGVRSDQAARHAYRKLHRQLGRFVSRDGLLATSSCSARLSLDGWRDAVREGLSGDWSWHGLSTEPVDHPTALAHREGHYLKFALLRRR